MSHATAQKNAIVRAGAALQGGTSISGRKKEMWNARLFGLWLVGVSPAYVNGVLRILFMLELRLNHQAVILLFNFADITGFSKLFYRVETSTKMNC